MLKETLCLYPVGCLQFGSFFKDTTDYVAYVAKDPVNRRGMCLIEEGSVIQMQRPH